MLNPKTRYSFDGSSGLDLPDTAVSPESFPGSMFTVRIEDTLLSKIVVDRFEVVPAFAKVHQTYRPFLPAFDLDATRGKRGQR